MYEFVELKKYKLERKSVISSCSTCNYLCPEQDSLHRNNCVNLFGTIMTMKKILAQVGYHKK
ncbi:hypothetical protein BgiMline_022416, partial [Biomphalaria glabrata]